MVKIRIFLSQQFKRDICVKSLCACHLVHCSLPHKNISESCVNLLYIMHMDLIQLCRTACTWVAGLTHLFARTLIYLQLFWQQIPCLSVWHSLCVCVYPVMHTQMGSLLLCSYKQKTTCVAWIFLSLCFRAWY